EITRADLTVKLRGQLRIDGIFREECEQSFGIRFDCGDVPETQLDAEDLADAPLMKIDDFGNHRGTDRAHKRSSWDRRNTCQQKHPAANHFTNAVDFVRHPRYFTTNSPLCLCSTQCRLLVFYAKISPAFGRRS